MTDVSASQINIRLGKLGTNNTGYQTYDHSWNLMDNGVWRNRPNDGTGIQAPLGVGKTWSFRSTDLNNTADQLEALRHVESGRAGKCHDVSGHFRHFQDRDSIEVQSIKDPTKKIRIVQQTWYAPSIDHWVKRSSVSRSATRVIDKNTIELVEYGRR